MKPPKKPSNLSSVSEISRLKQKGIRYYYEKGSTYANRRYRGAQRQSPYRTSSFKVGVLAIIVVFVVFFVLLKGWGGK